MPGLLAEFPRLHKIGWLMDDPFYHVARVGFDLEAFDVLYTVEESLVAPLRLATGKPVACVPLAADHETYQPLAPASGGERYDLVFVGKSYHDRPAGLSRRNVLHSVSGCGLSIWGDPGWQKVGLGACYRGGPVWPEQTNAIYNRASAVINIHHPQLRYGTSLRTFSICAAGAFQLVDALPGLSGFLEPAREVVTYTQGEDLAEQVRRYSTDTAARQRVAAAGCARVRAEHTYVNRMKRIVSDFDASTCRG
jgi:spore maturation protein CgeB